MSCDKKFQYFQNKCFWYKITRYLNQSKNPQKWQIVSRRIFLVGLLLFCAQKSRILSRANVIPLSNNFISLRNHPSPFPRGYTDILSRIVNALKLTPHNFFFFTFFKQVTTNDVAIEVNVS